MDPSPQQESASGDAATAAGGALTSPDRDDSGADDGSAIASLHPPSMGSRESLASRGGEEGSEGGSRPRRRRSKQGRRHNRGGAVFDEESGLPPFTPDEDDWAEFEARLRADVACTERDVFPPSSSLQHPWDQRWDRRSSGGGQHSGAAGSGGREQPRRSTLLPNGAIGLFRSPNGDVMTAQGSLSAQKAFLARPRSESNFTGRPLDLRMFSHSPGGTGAPSGGRLGPGGRGVFSSGGRPGHGSSAAPVERMKSCPVRSAGDGATPVFASSGGARRRRTVDLPPGGGAQRMGGAVAHPRSFSGGLPAIQTTNGGAAEPRNLSQLSKEELYLMWKASERALNNQLREALRQKSELQRKLSSTERLSVT